MAAIDGPDGMRLRLGVVHPEDAGRWRAEPKGRTVELDAAGVRDLRSVLLRARADGRQNVADFRARLRAAHAAGEPEPEVEAQIASGVIRGARWGDIRWDLRREEGPDYVAGGVNYGPGGEWNLSLDPAADGTLRDDFNAASDATIRKLDQALAGLIAAGT